MVVLAAGIPHGVPLSLHFGWMRCQGLDSQVQSPWEPSADRTQVAMETYLNPKKSWWGGVWAKRWGGGTICSHVTPPWHRQGLLGLGPPAVFCSRHITLSCLHQTCFLTFETPHCSPPFSSLFDSSSCTYQDHLTGQRQGPRAPQPQLSPWRWWSHWG